MRLMLTPPTLFCAGMDRKDWLALCAVHSDAWLYSLAFFYAARFDADGRAELFSLINQHPTVYEVREEQGGEGRGGPGHCGAVWAGTHSTRTGMCSCAHVVKAAQRSRPPLCCCPAAPATNRW